MARQEWKDIENADPYGWDDPEGQHEIAKMGDNVAPPVDPVDLAGTPQVTAILRPQYDKAGNDVYLPTYIRRNGRRKLTRTCQNEICDAIAKGAFEQHAAEAAGVPLTVFAQWLSKSPNFRRNVMQAAAKAKNAVTQHLAATKPETWAIKGPGREKPGSQGFASQTQITGAGGHDLKLGAAPPAIDLTLLSEQELLDLRALVSKARPALIEGEFTETTETTEEKEPT
jgi:hypothetical protein